MLISPLRVKNRRELNAGLKGRTLADLDDEEKDVDDARKWIKRSKKQEKILAKKRQEELENMDKVFLGDDYTESKFFSSRPSFQSSHCIAEDLEGLKVSHDFEGMEDGEARILTLKDSRILDNEGTHMSSPSHNSLLDTRSCCRGRTSERRDG